jgi:UDP-2,3-diacylglucosamine pyrophosphatase LpxH
MKKRHYRTIVLSDIHLGARSSQADQVLKFLEHHDSDYLYLNGDIIDAWALRRKWYWQSIYNDIIRKILKKSTHGTRVFYIAGNHDEFLRTLMTAFSRFGDVTICNEVTHAGADGRSYLVVHGDLFDGVHRLAPWLSVAGARGYEFIIAVNHRYNQIRQSLGLGYWSFSRWIKKNIKKAVNHVFQFEVNLVHYCQSRGFDGVICGHIHTPAIKTIDSLIYMNSGDWQESCSALVEHADGRWEILDFSRAR